MPLGVAIVQANKNAVRNQRRQTHDLDAGLLERGQAALCTGHDIHAVKQEILVAALVVDEQNLLLSGAQK